MNPSIPTQHKPSRSLHLFIRLALVLLLAAGWLALGAPPPTYAAGITVTTTTDELNTDGDCSLREAIQAANTDTAVDACTAGSGADTISVPAGTYTLALAGAGEDANATGDLDITGDVTISGAGAGTTIIDGNSIDRVLHIVNVSTVVIQDVTVRGGSVDSSSFIGGGIYNVGNLILNRVSVRNNQAYGRGAGIMNEGALSISASSIHNNLVTSSQSGAGFGGGMLNMGTSLTILNSTISDNTAPRGAAGVDTRSITSITNTTISNNLGGGPGGIAIVDFQVTFTNNIITANTPSNCGVFGGGSLTSNGYNLSSDSTCPLSGTGDATSTAPKLSALQDNIGGMLTRTLLPGSPAIDRIPNGTNGCGTTVTTDQRGLSRPTGSSCDSGAIESQGFTITTTGGDNQSADVNTTFATPLAAQLTETGAAGLPNVLLTFTGPGSGAGITPAVRTATTNTAGIASTTVSANGSTGSYTVQVTAQNVTSAPVFNLTNVAVPTINTVSPGSGPTAGGTSVMINGANLSGATSVTFGGVAAAIDSNTATSISVTTPPHAAGQVDVVVTTGSGSVTQTNGYVYIDVPTITTPANNSYVTTTSVNFAGTASPGSSVTVKEGSSTRCTATADGGGAWNCTATLGQGLHIVSVTSTIGAASTGPVTRLFTVDSLAPAPPSVDTPANGSATNDTTPAFGGSAEPNSSVTVQVDGSDYCTANADNNGDWGCTSSTVLSQSSHTVSAKATDAAGNIGAASASQSFTVDTTPPAAPVVTSPVDGSATNVATPVFSGTAEPGSAVRVRDGLTTLCWTGVDGSGNWSCTSASPLSEGIHNLAVMTRDAAYNDSTETTLALEIDLTAPPQPAIGTADTTGDQTPTIFGTAEPGSSIVVTVDSAPYCTATTTGAGNWSCFSGTPLPAGGHAVSVTATDPAGNASSPATLALTIDTTQPDAPAFSNPAITNDTTPIFAGTAEPNGTVRVTVDGTLYCTATANGAGNWNCTSATPLSAGSHAVTATATDAANNTSPPADQALTIDTGAPAAPVINSPAAINDTTPTFAGTAEPGATVTVSVDGVTVCTDIASGAGAWSCHPSSALTAGNHSVSVTATDAATNTSPPATQTLTVDITAPAAPTISSPVSGVSVNGPPTFTGTAEPGATVTVADGTTVICTATVDNAGNWSCTPATPLAEGSHNIIITVADLAGNTSVGAEVNLSVDLTPPSMPLITSRAFTTDSTPLLIGTAEPGSTVTVVLDPDKNPATNNSVTYVTTANSAGVWSIDTGSATPTSGTFPAGGLPLGSNVSVQVVARDAAGNASSTYTQSLYIGTQSYFPVMLANH